MENRNDILNELKQLSPLLAERKKENLFIVPENYFSKVEENVMKKIFAESVNAELQHSSLKEFKKQEVFDVPYRYFERLPNEILQKTSRKKSQTILESVKEYFQYSFLVTHLFGVTPMLAVMILAIVVLTKPVDVIETTSPVALVSNEEISNYLSDNISSLDESSIVAQMDDNSISKLASGIEQEANEYDGLLIDATQITIDDIQNL
ncbi:hypothetical protein LBMAG27_16840 [Bacteroidota bacterium]|nr:hypothetical protein LBMAG27_16840 [Bacteroidota bacterium]